MPQITYENRFSLVDGTLSIKVNDIFLILDNEEIWGNFLQLSGEYEYGHEDILTQWLGFLLFDVTLEIGHICDFSNYRYSGGDRFLNFWHKFIEVKELVMDIKSSEITLDDIFPKKIVFIASGTTKKSIFSLLDEEFENPTLYQSLFFDDIDEGVNYLLKSHQS